MLLYLLGDGSTEQWANQYGLTCPVLRDQGYAIGSQFEADGGYIPSLHLLAPGLEVVSVDVSWIMPGTIEQHLPEDYDPPWDNYEERMGG